MTDLFEPLKSASTASVRAQIRSRAYRGHTAGLGRNTLQANLAILPERYALDFMRYCQRNPKPCPIVGVSDTGNPNMDTLGVDIDIRTDTPAYYVYRDGIHVDTVHDLTNLWRDDFCCVRFGVFIHFRTCTSTSQRTAVARRKRPNSADVRYQYPNDQIWSFRGAYGCQYAGCP